MGAGGTKLPRSSPCSNSSASQAASQTSVLRPGRILTCRALTNNSSKPASSRTYQTGFQYWPVASITTRVTPSAASHPASASNPEVKVGNVRTSWARPPRPSGTRTQATTSSLATSNPAQRATSSSTVDTSLACGWCPAGPTDQATLKRVLTATVRGAGKAPASVFSTSSLAPRKAELGRAHRFSSLVAAPSHGGLIRYRGLSAVRTGVPQVAAERQGRSYAFLATSFQAVQASQTMPRAPSGT